MIKAFGGKNCWCFKDWMEINLSINKNVPSEYGFDSINILPLLCLIGPNASGKSNVLRILSFIKEFCIKSFYVEPNDTIGFMPFFDTKEPSEFYLNFFIGKDYAKEFVYEAKLNTHKVLSEKLTVIENKTKTVLFQRNNNKIKINNLTNNDNSFHLRDNASFISIMHQHEFEEISNIYDAIASIKTNLSLFDTFNEPNLAEASKYFFYNPDKLDRVSKEIYRLDAGIKNIKVEEIRSSNDNDYKRYLPFFTHETKEGAKILPIFFESYGTRVLFSQLYEIFNALDSGDVYIYDELDCHLHPIIAKEIINYFANRDLNKSKAQLIFSTHNLILLDELKKYNVYILNKEDGESYAYRVDEIKDKGFIRNDKSLADIYLQGLIGGIPNVKKK